MVRFVLPGRVPRGRTTSTRAHMSGRIGRVPADYRFFRLGSAWTPSIMACASERIGEPSGVSAFQPGKASSSASSHARLAKREGEAGSGSMPSRWSAAASARVALIVVSDSGLFDFLAGSLLRRDRRSDCGGDIARKNAASVENQARANGYVEFRGEFRLGGPKWISFCGLRLPALPERI